MHANVVSAENAWGRERGMSEDAPIVLMCMVEAGMAGLAASAASAGGAAPSGFSTRAPAPTVVSVECHAEGWGTGRGKSRVYKAWMERVGAPLAARGA